MGRGGGGSGGKAAIAGGGAGRTREATQEARDAIVNPAPLTDSERYAIHRYVSNDEFAALNQSLYEGTKASEDVQQRIALLDTGLQKVPTFQGETYRFVSFSAADHVKEKAFVDQFSSGDTVTLPAFTSTSKTQLSKYAAVQMTFKSRRGRDISGESNSNFKFNAREREVLFERNQSFRVESKKITYHANGRINQVFIVLTD